jgi:ABC-type multidrug transport system fused ATPase/permease subunit
VHTIIAGKFYYSLYKTNWTDKLLKYKNIKRFYDPLSGEITFDKKNLKDLQIKWIRNQIGVVNQVIEF